MKNPIARAGKTAGMVAAVATAGLLAAASWAPAQASVPTARTASAVTPSAPNTNRGRAVKMVVTRGATATRPMAGSACEIGRAHV